MLLSELLCISKGSTAIIGSGGKTTAMYILARELMELGSVVCTTSTRIYRPNHIPVYDGEKVDDLKALLLEEKCVAVGTQIAEGKIAGGAIDVGTLETLADYVLVEADGSRGLPMKAHQHFEPVIPKNAGTVLLIVGAEGFGKPVKDAAHRAECFSELSGLSVEELVTPAAVAEVINAENLAEKVFVNQVESEETMKNAYQLSELVKVPVFAGALRRGEWVCLS